MPRFKQLPHIQQLMGSKDKIRNIGIIAHIDHGKTTLADSLLAGAGLLSHQMAGMARVLDYLDEEQKRKITIKTANVTLLYPYGNNSYIINLIDTPGHVDFTGKVTRALRIIDGVVVVVDAVEEIMAQTEVLVRQALAERVRPVLFINKIDRLITELQLNEEQIQKKLDQIISKFNDQLELYAEEGFKKQWRINALKGNVAFGSALDGWGFTLDKIKGLGIKFTDIMQVYKTRVVNTLRNKLPVSEAIIEMVVKILPNPREAQSYRVHNIWAGSTETETGRALIDCSEKAAAVMYVTHVQIGSNNEMFATGRIFSGKTKKGDTLHLLDSAKETTVKTVFLEMGSLREEVSEVSAGNLATLVLADKIRSGETLVDVALRDVMVPFERISYVSEPVVTIAVEPKNPQDMPTLQQGLEKLVTEDPNLHSNIEETTGEILLSGMGELHLEIAINQLKNNNSLDLTVSSPRVVYMESAQKKGIIVLAKSANEQNSFCVQVEPSKPKQSCSVTDKKQEIILSVDDHQNVLLDPTCESSNFSASVLKAVVDGFQYICEAGPLCGEPINNLEVKLLDLKLGQSVDESEVKRGIGKAIFASFLSADPTLLEPVYRIVISVTSDLASKSSKILTIRRGKVFSFEQKGYITKISGFIPVKETFGFSEDLRSATSGKAIWQLFFDHWEKMPPNLASETISKLRKRRGLSSEIQKSEKFLE